MSATLLPLSHAIARLSELLAAVQSSDADQRGYALRRLANGASDVETEAARLAAVADADRCADWDQTHGYAVGPRATRISPPVSAGVA